MRIALARKSNFYEINDKSLQSSYIHVTFLKRAIYLYAHVGGVRVSCRVSVHLTDSRIH